VNGLLESSTTLIDEIRIGATVGNYCGLSLRYRWWGIDAIC